jgi:hypothetical protein
VFLTIITIFFYFYDPFKNYNGNVVQNISHFLIISNSLPPSFEVSNPVCTSYSFPMFGLTLISMQQEREYYIQHSVARCRSGFYMSTIQTRRGEMHVDGKSIPKARLGHG